MEMERKFMAKFVDFSISGFKSEEELRAFVAAIAMAAKTNNFDISGSIMVLSNMPPEDTGSEIDKSNLVN